MRAQLHNETNYENRLPTTSREYPLLQGNYNIVRTTIRIYRTTHPHVTLTRGPFDVFWCTAGSTCGLRPEGLRVIAPLGHY